MATRNAKVYQDFLSQREKTREALLRNKSTGESVFSPEDYNSAREDKDMARKMDYGKDVAIFVNPGDAIYDDQGNLIRIRNVPQLLTDRAVAHRLRVVKGAKDIQLMIIRDPLVIGEILKNNISRPSYSVDVFSKLVKAKDGEANDFKFVKTTTVEAKDVPQYKDSLSVQDFLRLYTSIDQAEAPSIKSAGSVSLSDL